MHRQEFTEAYKNSSDRSIVRSIGHHSLTTLLEPFSNWEDFFADSLTQTLLDGPVVEAGSFDKSYFTHVMQMPAHAYDGPIYETVSKLDIKDPEESAYQVINQHNFHVMSQSMVPNWFDAITDYLPTRQERRTALEMSMTMLAFESIKYAVWRKQAASIAEGHAYFQDENTERRALINGILTEIDAAIVLVDHVMQNPDRRVVPAPGQYEHGASSATNADFIMFDNRTDHAVGIQVKTKVHQSDIDKYDHERILLLDGGVDLGGRIWTRTKDKSSGTEYVNWPGMIAAEVISSIPLHGKRNTGMSGFDPKWLLNKKREASMLLKPIYDSRKIIRGTLSEARKKAGEKLTPFLDPTT